MKKKPFSSTLSPHAQPYFSSTRFPSTSTSSSSSVFLPSTIVPHAIDYDNPYSAYIYHFSDYWDPTPVSVTATPSSHVQPAPSPCPTLQNLQVQIASSKLSSDDDRDSLIDSPCYKGRNWSLITPLHMGQTSPPPRVTVDKLAEEQNMSAAVTTLESLMVSHEKESGFSSLPVSVGFLGPPHHNLANQELDPGFKREGILQTIVDLSNMLLQIPLNAADLSESDYEMVNVIIKDLKKLQKEYKKGNIRKLAKVYRLDEEKGKTNTCSAVFSQPQNCYIDDNVDNIEATVYKDLWMSAKIEKHEMEYKLQHARMAVDTETNN